MHCEGWDEGADKGGDCARAVPTREQRLAATHGACMGCGTTPRAPQSVQALLRPTHQHAIGGEEGQRETEDEGEPEELGCRWWRGRRWDGWVCGARRRPVPGPAQRAGNVAKQAAGRQGEHACEFRETYASCRAGGSKHSGAAALTGVGRKADHPVHDARVHHALQQGEHGPDAQVGKEQRGMSAHPGASPAPARPHPVVQTTPLGLTIAGDKTPAPPAPTCTSR